MPAGQPQTPCSIFPPVQVIEAFRLTQLPWASLVWPIWQTVVVVAGGARVAQTDPPPAMSNFWSRHRQPDDMFCPSRQACPAVGVMKHVPLGIRRIGSSHRQPLAIASLFWQARPGAPVGVGVGVGTGVAVDTGVGVGDRPSGTHRPILPATR